MAENSYGQGKYAGIMQRAAEQAKMLEEARLLEAAGTKNPVGMLDTVASEAAEAEAIAAREAEEALARKVVSAGEQAAAKPLTSSPFAKLKEMVNVPAPKVEQMVAREAEDAVTQSALSQAAPKPPVDPHRDFIKQLVRENQIISNPYQPLATESLEKVSESPSLLKRFGSKAAELAAQYPKAMQGLKVAGKVAGPALAAYDMLESEDVGANSDLVQGPMMTARELQNSEPAMMADTDQVPETRALASAPGEEYGPPVPSLLPDSPKGPSLFDRVSNVLSSKDMGEDSSNVPGLAKAQSVVKSSGKSSSVGTTPAKIDPAVEKARIDADQGYQLGTIENLQNAQSKQNILNFLGGLSETGQSLNNNMEKIGDQFTAKPSGLDFKNNTGANLRKTGEQIVSNQKDAVENQKNDPKSQTSAEMRNLIREMGFPVSDNVSGADLDKKFAGLTNIYTQRKAQEARAEQANLQREYMSNQNAENRKSREAMAELSRESKKEREIAQKDSKLADYTVKAAQRINQFEQTDEVKTFRSANTAKNLVDSAIKETDPGKRRALLGPAFMLFAKIAQGDASVVRESDLKMLTTSYGLNSDLINKIEAAAKGNKGITDEDLRGMQNVIGAVAELKKQHIAGQIEKEKALGAKLYPGMTYDGLFNPDTLNSIGYDSAGNPKPKEPGEGEMTKESAEKTLQGSEPVKNKTNTYPKQMRKNGQVATVSSAEEEAEARKEEWK